MQLKYLVLIDIISDRFGQASLCSHAMLPGHFSFWELEYGHSYTSHDMTRHSVILEILIVVLKSARIVSTWLCVALCFGVSCQGYLIAMDDTWILNYFGIELFVGSLQIVLMKCHSYFFFFFSVNGCKFCNWVHFTRQWNLVVIIIRIFIFSCF